ncbi:MAG: flagellar hook-basal body complex protein FliE [Candidatus Aquicultor secundus]|uniref:Flagellar hook-basal body complex protein FliE n=1 Tax=Candidatus Aquicultor secundus TaxID=1973895 RepID=A0A2M7T7I7_9ACTN|nr:flagellar hook-basal body complex protein FliE [Candidatus Aquicultor secundus]NCO66677.1 flagellar hook-basal body complex protein FliE [Solirubrobacter sp.]OIO85619.1 MAG: flagellar hook-basal body complex protein FliE [Candidatus Aquicultor secundus]PIU26026.1 MAG: flagellar hook-basal body complex protein FliE [Candidatus Aquicultor secundus]PIW21555.1 MAG: flagellar hook-basal body complex protein FliE [Candidatus Aquicultor secundus]PIX52669.1 MAG: flagellar hook-basal body complex pr
MDITPLRLNPISAGTLGAPKAESPAGNALDTFSGILNNEIHQVDAVQKSADTAVEKFIAGELDIHDVMIEVEKASVAMQLTVQLRNKVMEAYQEVMRMQV